MKKTFLLLFCLFLEGAALHSHVNPSPGCYFFEGDYLYQLPSVDDTYFVIQSASSNSSPIGTRINNDFNYNYGFRVGGGYAFCNCNRSIEGYYTRLCNHERKYVEGDNLWATNGFSSGMFSNFDNYTGSAESNLSLYYQRGDAFINQQVYCCDGAEVDFLIGAEYFNLRFKEFNEYIAQGEGTITWDAVQRSKAWGAGPEFGFTFNYIISDFFCLIPGTLRFTSYGTGSILASRTFNTFRNLSDDSLIFSVTDRTTWRLIPAIHARFGLNYVICLACGELALEAGYEFSSYFRALSKTGFSSSSGQGLSTPHYYNFGMQGLYAQAGFYF